MVEGEELVKGWERLQVWEHTASVHLDEAHVALVNAKRSRNFTSGQLKSLSVQLGNAQEELAKYMMVVVDRKAHIEDVGLVRLIYPKKSYSFTSPLSSTLPAKLIVQWLDQRSQL